MYVAAVVARVLQIIDVGSMRIITSLDARRHSFRVGGRPTAATSYAAAAAGPWPWFALWPEPRL